MLKAKLFPERGNVVFQLPAGIFSIIFLLSVPALSQERELDIGLRFQKSINLYYENGVTLQYTDERLLSKRLFIGFSYVSSRLGTAMGSNAIKQDNFLLSGTWMFRPQRSFQPLLRLNTGYFISDYEDPDFDVLPNSSILISPEFGVGYRFAFPLKTGISLGYNVITGDGLEGPGTLYPLYVQTSITWNIFAKNDRYENDL